MISLTPIIASFESDHLTLDHAALQQRKVAESDHQQDNDTFVVQWCSQTKGWKVSLIALEVDGGVKGYISKSEFDLLMSIKDIQQVLTLKHHLAPGGIRVMLESLNLRPIRGTVDYCDDTRFVGSIVFRMV